MLQSFSSGAQSGTQAPGGITPVTGTGQPLQSAQDYYWNIHNAAQGSAFNRDRVGQLLPSLYQQNLPGNLGSAHLAQTLSNPYATNDAARREALEGSEQAYQVAENRIRGGTLGSGQGRGGVARGLGGQVEMARGSDMARNLREHEQFTTQLGDQRLASLLMPYLGHYNQAYGITKGVPTQGNNSSADLANTAIALAGLFV